MTDEEERILRDVTDRLKGERTSRITFSADRRVVTVRRWDGVPQTFKLHGPAAPEALQLMHDKARGFARLGPNGQLATRIVELVSPPL